MKKIAVIFLIALVVMTLIGCSDSGDVLKQQEEIEQESNILRPLTEQEKLEDFEYLYQMLSKAFVYFHVNQRVNNIDWLNNKETYINLIKSTNDDESFFRALNVIMRDLNDTHTIMLDQVSVAAFREHYYNQAGAYEFLNHEKVVKRYDLEPITERGANLSIEPMQNLGFSIENIQTRDVIDGKVAYMNIPAMIPPMMMSRDEEVIDEYLQRIKDYQALIIDIRENVGGIPLYWQEYLIPRIISKPLEMEVYSFVKTLDYVAITLFGTDDVDVLDKIDVMLVENLDKNQFPNLPPEVNESFKYYFRIDHLKAEPHEDSIKFNGNIYLLVDRHTYSAADHFAAFAKDTNFATLIGQRTKGGGLGMPPYYHMLPNSGYVFSISTGMGVRSDGTVHEEHRVVPHYELDFVKKNPSFQYDSAILKVLELENLEIEQ